MEGFELNKEVEKTKFIVEQMHALAESSAPVKQYNQIIHNTPHLMDDDLRKAYESHPDVVIWRVLKSKLD